MAFRSSSFVLVFAIAATAMAADPETQKKINGICYQMEEYGFCNKVFNDNLRGPADYVGLTKITIDQVVSNSTNTHSFIVELLKSATEPAVKNALTACENGYNIVQQYFQQASSYFNQRDYQSMMRSETVTPRAQASCTSTFATPPFPPNPLNERNREMRILIAMAVVTGHNLV